MTSPITANDRAVIAFTALYMAASLASTLFVRNKEFLFYFVVQSLLMTVAWQVHRAIRLHPAALWGLSIWGLLHMSGGLVPIPDDWPRLGGRVLYNLWLIPERLKYDHVVHAYGFGLMTWVSWQGLRRTFENRRVTIAPSGGLLILCVAAGMGFGALNEVVEFAAAMTIPGTNVGGYENTGWDLVSNLAGCLIAAGLIWLLSRPT